MQIISNESIYPFDVDKTLVSARRRVQAPGDIGIMNPYTNEVVYVKPHEGHVNLLKEMFGRDRFIIVWSAAGVKWAAAVIEALGIEDYVHIVQTKPIGYIDDISVEHWLQNRIYLADDERS